MNLNTRKLTPAEVRELRAWWKKREEVYQQYVLTPNPREIGLAYGISPDTARRVARGERYKEVQ